MIKGVENSQKFLRGGGYQHLQHLVNMYVTSPLRVGNQEDLFWLLASVDFFCNRKLLKARDVSHAIHQVYNRVIWKLKLEFYQTFLIRKLLPIVLIHFRLKLIFFVTGKFWKQGMCHMQFIGLQQGNLKITNFNTDIPKYEKLTEMCYFGSNHYFSLIGIIRF